MSESGFFSMFPPLLRKVKEKKLRKIKKCQSNRQNILPEIILDVDDSRNTLVKTYL